MLDVVPAANDGSYVAIERGTIGCLTKANVCVSDVSARDLRNHTVAVLRRAEAGERLRVTVSRRPVAQLVPIERSVWASGPAMERVLREAPADAGLLHDLAPLREQTIESE